MVSFANLVAAPSSSNIYIETLTWDFAFRPGYVITYAFTDPALWASTGAADAFNQSMAAWQAVANFTSQYIPNYTAVLRSTTTWVEALGNPSGEPSVLGQHDLPGTNNLEGYFNQNHPLFSAANNVRGGFSYVTFLHEIGHGLGLLHPHDDGFGDPTFPGVSGSGDLGDFRLNQGIYTVMTYNDGSVDVGLSPSNAYGWAYGPMAFDIAAIQLLYGANTSTGAGTSSYSIPGVNAVGTGYISIWDVSGTDTISAAGVTADSTIDLRAATLLREVGGGGWLSRADGIYGGVTIANGVVIENAMGGSGRDRLIGNGANNTLDGGAGFDTVDYSMVTAALTINLRSGSASGTGIGSDTLISVEHAVGGSGNDTITAIAGVSGTPTFEIVKPASIANTEIATALSLTGRFNLNADAYIANATTVPHATVRATSSGGTEFYSFSVGATGSVVIDIDAAFGIDTFLTLRRADGSTVTTNNDASRDAGSTSGTDSRITATLSAGTYTVAVGVNAAGASANIPAGSIYTLHVSVPGAPIASGTVLRGSVLDGGAGNDTLVGGEGDDVLVGGAGTDRASFAGVAAGVTVNLATGLASGGQGSDQLHGIENILGSSLSDTVTGNSGDNQLDGSGGDDMLFGGDGIDVIIGGEGNDTLSGEGSNDTLIGGNGNDRLAGGAGNNELIGGAGDDVYTIESTGDSIIESLNEGTDEARTARASFVLPTHVEALVFTGTGSFIGNGNAGNNIITGGIGSDQLSGLGGNDQLRGGTGAANTLIGGIGDDIYVVDVIGDSTLELAGEGVDEVRTTFSIYGLQANVENLTFTDNARHAAGVGNALDNVITGGTGNDDLFGRTGNDTLRGGSGSANTLIGQQGDDIYVSAAIGDSIFEVAGEGFDTVQTALPSFVLRLHVEALTYIGTGNFTGIGAEDANTLRGGAGDDFLSGLGGDDILIGGKGADQLLGGTGADRFAFEGGETAIDRIIDFVSGTDKIALRDAGFAQTATFVLVQGAGTQVATGTNSAFLHNTATGLISFDADGAGAGAAVVIAQVNAGLTLSASDFLFY